MKDILLIGGGGHCRSVIDVIESSLQYKIVGIVDKKENLGKKVLSYAITHSDEDLESLFSAPLHCLITLGQIKSPELRRQFFNSIKSKQGLFPTLISPRAYVSPHAFVDEGTVILHGAIVNAGARIGKNCIINSQALIEHDTVIEDHCHISTASVLNGEVIVREGSFVGSQAMIRETCEIPKNSIVPAGTCFFKRSHGR